MIGTERPTLWPDVTLALLLFVWPPMTVWITLAWREVGRLRREREALLKERDASRAEGYPPPGPPTT